MLILSRQELELFKQYVDVNNYKYEFNCLFVEDGYLFATNTRAAIRKKVETVDRISVHSETVRIALSVKKAIEFKIEDKAIICIGKDDEEIITLRKNHKFNYEKPLKINDVFPEKFESHVRFNNNTQINGIFAVNGVSIDEKYIPKKLPREIEGIISINKPNLPVGISYGSNIEILIMPIIDNYLIEQDSIVA